MVKKLINLNKIFAMDVLEILIFHHSINVNLENSSKFIKFLKNYSRYVFIKRYI